jgi:hypothetical protein
MPDTGPYPAPNDSSTHPSSLFKMLDNVIHAYIPVSSK